MRSFRVLVAVVAVVFALGFSVNVASAFPGASQECKATNNFDGFFASHGECVSVLENYFSTGNAGPVGFCKAFENLGADNLGECVSFFRR